MRVLGGGKVALVGGVRFISNDCDRQSIVIGDTWLNNEGIGRIDAWVNVRGNRNPTGLSSGLKINSHTVMQKNRYKKVFQHVFFLASRAGTFQGTVRRLYNSAA
jgi:hypothetical protein